FGGTGNARRSNETAAVDVEKSAALVAGTAGSGPFSLSPRDRGLPARTGIQSASEQQETGGQRSRGSGRTVSVHQRSGQRVSGGARAGCFGRYQKERTGGELQKQRSRTAPQ